MPVACPPCTYVCLVPDLSGCMQADGPHLVMVSRIAVAVWAVIMGIAMCIAQVANININWLILLIGARLSSCSLCMHCLYTCCECARGFV